MSLELHLPDRAEALLTMLRPRLTAARRAALAAGPGIPRPIPVLVPSAQIGDWLQVRLARDLGLSMGFEFLQPRAYFNRQPAATAPDSLLARLAASHAFWTPDNLRWHILPEIDAIARRLGHDPAHPLGPRERFAFAELLARQLDRYGRFRPEWLAQWQSGRSAWKKASSPTARDDEAWQRELWRTLAQAADEAAATPAGGGPHPALLLANDKQGARVAPGAATPLFVIGTDIIDPLLMETLLWLSRHGQPVSLFIILPSLGYLGDIPRRTGRSAFPFAELSGYLEPSSGGHPLLTSLGQQAVGTFLLLGRIDPDYAHWPDDAAGDAEDPTTLLGRLQSDIRQQHPPPGAPAPGGGPDLRPEFSPADRSLRIHCCHSPRRELEVLRDELLRAFTDLPGLQPQDVLVAVTDFDTYAPLAESILRSGPHPLPVRLTAIPAREANPIAMALLALLRLSLGRRSASELMELFNLTAIQHRLEIAGEPRLITRVLDAIRQSGLTHGLDPGKGGDTGSWRAALDRQLAGTWFGPMADACDGAGGLIHPLAGDLHHDDELVGRLLAWLTDLARHLSLWERPDPPSEWGERLRLAAGDLLHSAPLDDHASAVDKLVAELAAVTARTPLDAGAMADWLASRLENAGSLRTTMGGEILLGRIDQLHGLPCRVLAILGLQDGAFPRAARQPAWDLLGHAPERWDADPRRQDRQWFLDCLLAPRDRLILAAANRSLRTSHDGPLASCVEDVLRVAGATLRAATDAPPLAKQLVVQHRMHPFAADYFTPTSLLPPSFDKAASSIARSLATSSGDKAPPFFTKPLPASGPASDEPATLSLEQLVSFWRDPARAWLRSLSIDLGEEDRDDTDLDDAPVELDALKSYEVRTAALHAHLSTTGPDPATVGHRLAADRTLPPGTLGALAWQLHEREITPLVRHLLPLLERVERHPVEIAFAPAAILSGEVRIVSGDGDVSRALVYRAGKYEKRTSHQLAAFICTLAAATQLNRPVGGLVMGIDHSELRILPAIPPEEARPILERMIAGCLEGRRCPLCFAPETSAALLAVLDKDNDPVAALEHARTTWSQDAWQNQSAGEGLSPAATLVWRDADPFSPEHEADWLAWAEAVIRPLRTWWDGEDAPPDTPAAKKPRRSGKAKS